MVSVSPAPLNAHDLMLSSAAPTYQASEENLMDFMDDSLMAFPAAEPLAPAPALPPTPKPRPRAAPKRQNSRFKQVVSAVMVATNEFLHMETTENMPEFRECDQPKQRRKSFLIMEDASDPEEFAVEENYQPNYNEDMDTGFQDNLRHIKTASDRDLHSQLSPLDISNYKEHFNSDEPMDAIKRADNSCEISPVPSLVNTSQPQSYNPSDNENYFDTETSDQLQTQAVYGESSFGSHGEANESVDMELSPILESAPEVPLRFKPNINDQFVPSSPVLRQHDSTSNKSMEEMAPDTILRSEVEAQSADTSRDSLLIHPSEWKLSPSILRRPISKDLQTGLETRVNRKSRKTVAFVDETIAAPLKSIKRAENNLLDFYETETEPGVRIRSNLSADESILTADDDLKLAHIDEMQSLPTLKKNSSCHAEENTDPAIYETCLVINEKSVRDAESQNEFSEETNFEHNEVAAGNLKGDDVEPEVNLRSNFDNNELLEIVSNKLNLSASPEVEEPVSSEYSPPVMRRSKGPTAPKEKSEDLDSMKIRTLSIISGGSILNLTRHKRVDAEEKDLSPPVLRQNNATVAHSSSEPVSRQNSPSRYTSGAIPKIKAYLEKSEKRKTKNLANEEMPLFDGLKATVETAVPPNSPMKSDEEEEPAYKFKLQRSKKSVVKKNSQKSRRVVSSEEASKSSPPASPPTLRRTHDPDITIANLTQASALLNPEFAPTGDKPSNFIPPFEGDGDYDFVIDREKRTTRMISINEFPVLPNPPAVMIPQRIQEQPPIPYPKSQIVPCPNAQRDAGKANPKSKDDHSVETRRKPRNVNYTLTYPMPVNKYLLKAVYRLSLSIMTAAVLFQQTLHVNTLLCTTHY